MNVPAKYQGSDIVGAGPSALALQPGGEPVADRLDLRSLLSLFRRQLLVIATVTGICVLVAIIVTQATPKTYTASADLLLKPLAEAITPRDDAQDDRPRGTEQVETEMQMLQSIDLAAKVYDRLDLGRNRTFVDQMRGGGGIGALLGLRGPTNLPLPRSAAAQALRAAAIPVLASSLSVKRIGNSYALRVTATSRDAALSAQIANAYAQTYVADQLARKVGDTQRAIVILRQRMEELRLQAQADFATVQQYRIANRLQSQSGTSLTEQEISAYNQQVATARAQAREDAARLAAARSSGAASSPVVNAMRTQRAAISVRVAELSERYLPSHPELISARQQLADLDLQIATEVSRAIRTAQGEAQASASRLSSFENSLSGASGTLNGNNRSLIALDDLNRKAAASQALYESYLSRYKEVVARSGAEQPTASLLSAASPPAEPSSPNLPLNAALGLLVGLLAGAVAAIIVESAYSGLTTSEDVEKRLLLRCIGIIPLLDSVDVRAGSPVATIGEHPGGVFAEAFRGLLGASRQSNNSRNQVLAVTSALPGEGKTTLAACLARTAARAHERVAIIDCDVVHRQLSAIHGREMTADLRELLEGRVKLDAFLPSPELDGVTLFGLARPFEAGSRLIEQGRLHRVIAQLREHYDVIVLDCAPVLPIAETRDVVGLADTVLFVARWRKTGDRVVRAALKLLPLQQIGDLGVVLNGVDLRKRLRFGEANLELFSSKYKTYYAASA